MGAAKGQSKRHSATSCPEKRRKRTSFSWFIPSSDAVHLARADSPAGDGDSSIGAMSLTATVLARKLLTTGGINPFQTRRSDLMTMNNTRGWTVLVGMTLGVTVLAATGCESATQASSRAAEPTEAIGAVQAVPDSEHASPKHASHSASPAGPEAEEPGCCGGAAQPHPVRTEVGHSAHAADAPTGQACAGESRDETCMSGRGAVEHGGAAATGFASPPQVGAKARCPVMGNEFTVGAATTRSVHGGRHYVFCCPGCKPKFDASPQKYL